MKHTTLETHAYDLATQRLPPYLREALKIAHRKALRAAYSGRPVSFSKRAQTALDRVDHEVAAIEKGRRPRRST